MHRLRAMILTLLTAAVCPGLAAELTNKWSFDSPGNVTYDDTGIASATNGFTVIYGDVRIVADYGMVNRKTGDAVAQGSVRIERGSQVWQGERIEYNFESGKLVTENFRTGQNPFFVR